ncbi:uncharacterized protein BDZ99DRAFT_435917 [Mytilinidion resinicola]|uniref:Uncharacterized protein n=1 Tax=Mytilinidion resinicola TaxID=574789 RepID=A0A6A6Z5P1_9PEZI|nr:uncharacterized protein BDZ99DRAFT_435917 [Mytilinidion resinicola]KAF2815525.1 hypothetical protein BDZ99DRAFT_435917 [Mytilinidion resinicola]
MAAMIPADDQANYEIFRDCVSEPVLRILAAPPKKEPKKRRKEKRIKKGSKAIDGDQTGGLDKPDEEPNDAEDLGEFIDYLSHDIFTSLPASLRSLNHALYTKSPSLQSTYALPLSASTLASIVASVPVSIADSLTSYALITSPHYNPSVDLPPFLAPILSAYITTATAAPPPYASTRADACELCGRSWIPLTYHHLIPKSTHARVLKRGWHKEEALGSVAWLCRACHSFVHRCAGNEELAREWYTVELLMGREDVGDWVQWVGRVRWKKA